MPEEIVGDMGAGPVKKLNVEFPSNSKENKPKPVVERVVTGTAVRRKKTWFERVRTNFGGSDSRSVGSYIMYDIVVPAIKSMIADAFSQGTERLLFGDSRDRNRTVSRTGYSSYSRPGYTNYSKPYTREAPRTISHRTRATHSFDDIVIQSRGEAEEILDRLSDLINSYGVATVADLYEMAGITSDFTDGQWGWESLRGVSVDRVRNGYLLNLPPVQPCGEI